MKLSNTLLIAIFVFSLISVILLSLNHTTSHNIPFRIDVTQGPEWEKTNTTITTNERGAGRYIRFIYMIDTLSTGAANGCCADVAELDKLVQVQIRKERRNHSISENENPKWYWKSLPVDKNEYVILIWQDFKQSKYEWIAIKSTPAFWYTVRRNSKKNLVLDGRQLVCGWYIHNKYLEIRVKNPPNINGWTPYDIWYSFAESQKKVMKQIGSASWLSDLVDNTCHSDA